MLKLSYQHPPKDWVSIFAPSSCIMKIVTIVRRTGSGSVDIVWLIFWQRQECSTATIMVFVSAFRSEAKAMP